MLSLFKIIELFNYDHIFHYDISMSLCESDTDCHDLKENFPL